MNTRFGWIALLSGILVCPANVPQAAKDAKEVLGTWEGESICTIPDSPCKNEHVIYEIAEDEKSAGGLKTDAYKVVGGEKQFMGTLACGYDASAKTMKCTFTGNGRKNEWEFHVRGTSMDGTLVLDEDRKLYRKVCVKRKSGS
jgi:hypothetical protein